jgi:hypothetical protein
VQSDLEENNTVFQSDLEKNIPMHLAFPALAHTITRENVTEPQESNPAPTSFELE